MSYTKRAAELDEVVRGELEKIAKITAWSHGLYDGCTTGAGFSKPEQYLLMLNALAHASSSAMKSAIASRTLQPVCDLVLVHPAMGVTPKSMMQGLLSALGCCCRQVGTDESPEILTRRRALHARMRSMELTLSFDLSRDGDDVGALPVRLTRLVA